MKIGSLAFVALIVVGCGGKKSQTQTPANSQPEVTAKTELVQDLERICNAHTLSGAPADSGMSVAGPWLEKNVQTPEAKALLEDLKAGNFDRTRDEAKRHNVAPCPMLDPSAQQAGK